MSDIQELIHKTSMDCIKQGERQATERIIKLLEDDQTNCFCDDCYTNRATEVPFEVKHNEYLIALIKGEK